MLAAQSGLRFPGRASPWLGWLVWGICDDVRQDHGEGRGPGRLLAHVQRPSGGGTHGVAAVAHHVSVLLQAYDHGNSRFFQPGCSQRCSSLTLCGATSVHHQRIACTRECWSSCEHARIDVSWLL